MGKGRCIIEGSLKIQLTTSPWLKIGKCHPFWRIKQKESNTLHFGCLGVLYNIPIYPKNPHIYIPRIPSKIEWDLPNGPLTKLLELLDTKV